MAVLLARQRTDRRKGLQPFRRHVAKRDNLRKLTSPAEIFGLQQRQHDLTTHVAAIGQRTDRTRQIIVEHEQGNAIFTADQDQATHARLAIVQLPPKLAQLPQNQSVDTGHVQSFVVQRITNIARRAFR